MMPEKDPLMVAASTWAVETRQPLETKPLQYIGSDDSFDDSFVQES
jgi:hypothetical protein